MLLQFGNMSKDLANYNTQLFVEKVMPQLKDVFSEWEDRWWPRPMDREGRAALSSFRPGVANRGGTIGRPRGAIVFGVAKSTGLA
jgi:hypothetical protein